MNMTDIMMVSAARTSSVQTFDSLDFARYSDDGERQVDERVAGQCNTVTSAIAYNCHHPNTIDSH